MLVPGQNLPGIDAALETVENEFTFGPNGSWVVMGVSLNSAAVDAGSTPTTLLRKGLLLGKVTATGQYKQYDATATDGTEEPMGVLYDSVNMLDVRTGVVRDKSSVMLYYGHVKTGSLYGFNEYARVRLGNRIVWDDLRFPHMTFNQLITKAGNYTVLATDNGTHFTATAAVNFTLPAVARGLRYRFFQTSDNDLTVTAAAVNTMVTFNDVDADAVAFSTGGNKIGACVEVIANPAGTLWQVIPFGANTMTVTT